MNKLLTSPSPDKWDELHLACMMKNVFVLSAGAGVRLMCMVCINGLSLNARDTQFFLAASSSFKCLVRNRYFVTTQLLMSGMLLISVPHSFSLAR